MPDPFSVISGAAGVVSLGLTVCQGLVAYYGPFMEFNSETQSFVTRVKGLSATLELLQSRVNRLQSPENPHIFDELRLVEDRIVDCGAALQKLSEALQKCRGLDVAGIKKKGWKFARAQYPFKRGTLAALEGMVGSVQSNLEVAMQVLLLTFSNRIQNQTSLSLAASNSISSHTAVVQTTLGRIEDKHERFEHGQQQLLQMVMTLQQSQLAMVDRASAAGSEISRQSSESGTSPDHQPSGLACKRPASRILRQTRTSSSDCTCKGTRTGGFRSWGLLSSIRSHRFGCPMYLEREVTTLINSRITILSRFIGYSANVNITVVRNGPGCEICPLITLSSVVKWNAPAFNIVRDAGLGDITCEDALVQLRRLFEQGEASPRDRLSDGSTLIHDSVGRSTNYYWHRPSFYQLIKSLAIDFGVPLNEESDGLTVLDCLLRQHVFFANITVNPSALKVDLFQTLIRQGAVVTKRPLGEPLEVPVSTFGGRIDVEALHLVPIIGRNCGWQEFPLTPIEEATWRQSKEQVHALVEENESVEVPLSAMQAAIFWPQGLGMLIKSCRPSCLPLLLRQSIHYSQFGTLQVLLGSSQCRISNHTIYMASHPAYYKPAMFQLLAQSLAAQRRRLAAVAREYLDSARIQEFGLCGNEDVVLDAKASKVESALRELVDLAVLGLPDYEDSGLEGCQIPEDTSVHYAIAGNVQAVETLYLAGFTNFEHLVDQGLSPLYRCPTPGIAFCDDLNCRVTETMKMCQWLIQKGFPLMPPSSTLPFLPAHTLAKVIGDRSLIGYVLQNEPGLPIRDWGFLYENHPTLLPQILGDTRNRDTCDCACSSGGCLPITVCLRGYFWTADIGVARVNNLADMIEAHQRADTPGQAFEEILAPAVIRACTFAALKLRHTCRYHDVDDPDEGDIEIYDIAEVQEEERFLIQKLDDLVSEFEAEYQRLHLPLHEFIRGYWTTRMQEVSAEEDEFDEDEERAMQEVGVIGEKP